MAPRSKPPADDIYATIPALRWFQRVRLKLDKDLKFSEKVQNSCTFRRKQLTVPFERYLIAKLGENGIGSYGSLGKWPTICWILIFYVWFRLGKIMPVKIGILGTICSSLPIIYRLVILKHLKNNSVLQNEVKSVTEWKFIIQNTQSC